MLLVEIYQELGRHNDAWLPLLQRRQGSVRIAMLAVARAAQIAIACYGGNDASGRDAHGEPSGRMFVLRKLKL
jgi:hypothetical protein